MKALSAREARCYLAGCLKGDAWLSRSKDKTRRIYLCMRVLDIEFASEFSRCITKGFKLNSRVTVDERGYFLVRRYNKDQRFNILLDLEPETKREKSLWLRGIFDSEGSVEAKTTLKNSNWNRRIAMFSTNKETLKRVVQYLTELGISTRKTCSWSMTEGHKGKRQVYAVVLKSSKENFRRFVDVVGFTIFRHQLNAIRLCNSYSELSTSEICKLGQAKGAEVKRKKFLNEVLPVVLSELKVLAQNGQKLTQRNCAGSIIGYHTALHYFTHKQLLEKTL